MASEGGGLASGGMAAGMEPGGGDREPGGGGGGRGISVARRIRRDGLMCWCAAYAFFLLRNRCVRRWLSVPRCFSVINGDHLGH
jgi:hypothetical protein